MLAGCDFLPSLKGVSFRTAAGFVARRRGLEGALGGMRAEKRFRTDVTEEYRQGASRALLAFRHALGERGGGQRRAGLVKLWAPFAAQHSLADGRLHGNEIEARKLRPPHARSQFSGLIRAALNACLPIFHAVFCHNTGGGCLRRLVPLPGASWDQRQRAQQQPEQQEQAVPAATGAAGAHGLTEADLAHLGAELDAEVARGIAYGEHRLAALESCVHQPVCRRASAGGRSAPVTGVCVGRWAASRPCCARCR